MNKDSKKISLMVVGIAILIVLVTGITFAFFNYTRTGTSNVIRVGRISFVTRQTNTINLSNLFPIDPNDTNAMNDNTKVGTLSIEIEGDTDYGEGIEYLVSSVNSNIYTSSGKTVPISLDVTINNLGEESSTYWDSRESKNTTIYKKLVGDTLVGDEMLLVGYIKPNTTSGTIEGINGSITMKAYFDKNKILISDTYDGTESDNMGTTNTMAEEKTVITTAEWNALQQNGISFQVKVEANEGIWVLGSLEEIMKRSTTMDNIASTYVSASSGINFRELSSDTNGKGVYTRAGTENDDYPIMYYRGEVDNNVVFANKCWKAVRTTDTGGVKLIYNGVYRNIPMKTNNLTESQYLNIEQNPSDFSFDISDNSWNITFTSSESKEIAFNLPEGDDYYVRFEVTESHNNGGAMYVYKNSSYSAISFTPSNTSGYISLGTITNSDSVRVFFGLGGVNEQNILKIKFKITQNSTPLSQEDYTIDDKNYTFESNKWTTTLKTNERSYVRFNLPENKSYILEYNSEITGSLYIKKNDQSLSLDNSGSLYLGNMTSNDVISIEYKNYTSSEKTFYFTIYESNLVLSCDNYGEYSQISLTENNQENKTFNFNSDAFAPYTTYYMYGENYKSYSSQSFYLEYGKYFDYDKVYGNGFIYENGIYKLTETDIGYSSTRHYTCFNDTGICDGELAGKVYYLYYDEVTDSHYYNFIALENGDGVEDAINKMQKNTNNSNVKNTIDKWYREIMIENTNKIEDTTYCNDRSMNTFGTNQIFIDNGWNPNGNIQNPLYFSPVFRIEHAQPELSCNKNDAFTVYRTIGNGNLTYPVGMLSFDEVALAGGAYSENNNTYYLYNKNNYWLMSPYVDAPLNYEFKVNNNGGITGSYINDKLGVRPVISIKPGQLITKGTGTGTDPFVIE